MKKLATLALAMLVIPSVNSFAAGENEKTIDTNQKMEMKTETKEEKQNQMDRYEVIEVFDDTVTLRFIETLNGNQIPTYNGAEFNVAKEKFADEDIKIGDIYKITHDDIVMPSNPAQFGQIFSIEKDGSSNNEDENAKEEKVTQEFVVEKVNEDGYTIYDLKNKNNKYMISKKDAKNMDLLEGDTIEITHNGVIMESNPAQFNKIFDIKKLHSDHKDDEKEDSKEEKITEVFLVDEVNEGGYTISPKENKDNKYSISKEDTKGMDLVVGDKLEITHTGLATKSIPAQFVGDIEIRKVDNKSDVDLPSDDKDMADKNDKSDIKKENENDNKSNKKKEIDNEKMDTIKKDDSTSIKNKVAGANPKTGVLSSVGLIGSSAVAIAMAKKIRNY